MTDLQIAIMRSAVVERLDAQARARWTWLGCIGLGVVLGTLLAIGAR